jgi:hypothetical protein
MSFWQKSTGETLNSQTAKTEYQSGTDLAPIPKGTLLKAMPTEAKWSEYEGQRFINIRWDVIDGEYKKRIVFQKLRVGDSDSAKRDRAIDMLAAIDMNATGGKLMGLGREPSDIDLMSNLCNKPMIIRVQIWETEDKTKSGNWIDSVSSAKKSKPEIAKMVQQASAPAPAQQAAPAQSEPPVDYDEDVGF